MTSDIYRGATSTINHENLGPTFLCDADFNPVSNRQDAVPDSNNLGAHYPTFKTGIETTSQAFSIMFLNIKKRSRLTLRIDIFWKVLF